MTVEIIKRKNTIPQYSTEVYDEIFIDDKPVEMGEGVAELVQCHCKIHGPSKAIAGYNQGGHDYVIVCLKCCLEIISYLQQEGLKEI